MQASSKLETALEGVAFPTHVIMHSRRWNWLTAEMTDTWPMAGVGQMGALRSAVQLTNEYGPQVRGVLNNGLKVIVDNNVGTTFGGAPGTQDEIYVVAAGESVHFWEAPGAPVFLRAEQPTASVLGVQLVLYGYFAYATRYANAVSKVSDTGLSAPSGF